MNSHAALCEVQRRRSVITAERWCHPCANHSLLCTGFANGVVEAELLHEGHVAPVLFTVVVAWWAVIEVHLNKKKVEEKVDTVNSKGLGRTEAVEEVRTTRDTLASSLAARSTLNVPCRRKDV